MICPTCGWDNVPGNEACSHCQQDLTPFDRPAATCRVERSLMEDPASVLATHLPVTIRACSTVAQAIDLMIRRNVGAILVVDEQGGLLGIFSERDLLKKVVGLREDYAEQPVSAFMTPRPASVSTCHTLAFVLNKMDGGGYRHVPVVQDVRPVGIISVRDMLRHITRVCEQG